jgi:hypothetical protein
MSTTADSKLEQTIIRQGNKIRGLLSKRPRWKFWKRKSLGGYNPELIKVLGLIHSRLSEISRLIIVKKSNSSALPPDIERHLNEMAQEDLMSFDINSAWEFSDSLRRMTLLLGDDSYLLAQLANEKVRNADESASLKWGRYIDGARLDDLLKVYQDGQVTPAHRAQAIEYLSLVYSGRSNDGRHQRATVNLRRRYLNALTVTLTVLLFLLMLSTYFVSNEHLQFRPADGFMDMAKSLWEFPAKYLFNDPQVRLFIVAAFTGGIGSVLSGFFKLRDKVVGIQDLRSFKAAMWAQPFVGATIGVIFYLLVASGIFSLGAVNASSGKPLSIPWSLLGIYCFFAGFSEPFFLGVVQRVAGEADKQGGAQSAAARGKDNKSEAGGA